MCIHQGEREGEGKKKGEEAIETGSITHPLYTTLRNVISLHSDKKIMIRISILSLTQRESREGRLGEKKSSDKAESMGSFHVRSTCHGLPRILICLYGSRCFLHSSFCGGMTRRGGRKGKGKEKEERESGTHVVVRLLCLRGGVNRALYKENLNRRRHVRSVCLL